VLKGVPQHLIFLQYLDLQISVLCADSDCGTTPLSNQSKLVVHVLIRGLEIYNLGLEVRDFAVFVAHVGFFVIFSLDRTYTLDSVDLFLDVDFIVEVDVRLVVNVDLLIDELLAFSLSVYCLTDST
jgi:hypothetical protein